MEKYFAVVHAKDGNTFGRTETLGRAPKQTTPNWIKHRFDQGGTPA